MKKILSLVWLLLSITSLYAQFNNEWIDYGKTYYKIKLDSDGIYRITQPMLTAASVNLAATSAQDFQLWHNGVEVPLYTSVASGVLGSSDFIEFFGQRNDGKLDKQLYINPRYQLSDKQSLFTDTSVYFLTINAGTNNLRYSKINNALPAVLPTPAPFVWMGLRYEYKDGSTGRPHVNKGGYVDYSLPVYSSSYDSSEMLSSDDIYPSQTGTDDLANYKAVFTNMMPYTAGAEKAAFRISLAGNNSRTAARDIRITINGTEIGKVRVNYLASKVAEFSGVDAKMFQQTNTTIGVQNLGKLDNSTITANLNDRVVAGFLEIDYARLPNATNAKSFRFRLPASESGTYIEITDFAHNSIAPVLYELNSLSRMQCTIAASGLVQLYIPASSSTRDFLLVSQNEGGYLKVGKLTQRQFTNYSGDAMQGTYLIISNQRLMTKGASGPVDQYRAYRETKAGGSYQARIYDIEELVDQFAYGIKMHPLSIKNFLRFARQKYSKKPKYCFLIGKGVNYGDFRKYENEATAPNLQLVPTFGYPASDNVLASDNLLALPATFIGRLSAVNESEVSVYLNKVKEYESVQANPSQQQTEKLWMKNAINVVGANDEGTATIILPYMNTIEGLIERPTFGGTVTSFNKFNTTTASTIENEQLSNLFQNGFSLLTYFGHSSATKLDYDLDNPEKYNNPGKYPCFMLLGCNAGNLFDFDLSRLEQKNTISEKYVLAQNRGAIALIASTHYGLVGGLGNYATGYYQSISGKSYGLSVGQNVYDAINYMYLPPYGNTTSFSNRIHPEQQTLHGDPAIIINSFAKPDFSVESSNMLINPDFISISEANFKVKIRYYNLGRAVSDSIKLLVTRKLPNSDLNPQGKIDTVFIKKIKAPIWRDSLELTLPISPETDKGSNKITIFLDSDKYIDELDEANNTITTAVEIFENELRPVYPKNFAIVNKQGVKLIGSTSNPLSPSLLYRMEIDTTALFNSSAKLSKDVNTTGGIVEFDPAMVYTDSTVYYWRLALVPSNGGPILHWNTASFIYLKGNESGFNQSHLHQHTKSMAENLYIDSTSRHWKFNTNSHSLTISHSVFGTDGYTDDGTVSVYVDSKRIASSACLGHSTVFTVFNPVTFSPMRNYPGGLYGSGPSNCDNKNFTRANNFEWDDRTPANRKSMADFMDSIPNGSFVVVRKILDPPYEEEAYAQTMKADRAIYGIGNTLYDKLKAAGFAELDSFNRPRIYIFVYQKNNTTTFSPSWILSPTQNERIDLKRECVVPDTLGYITSPVFGPAKSWKTVLWKGNMPDGKSGDRPTIELIGIAANGTQKVLSKLDITKQNFDISDVNAKAYPFMQMQMRNADSINGTPYNLLWWRLYYTNVAEGALSSTGLIQGKDTLSQGEPMKLGIVFKNISETAFADSIAIKGYTRDNANNMKALAINRKKPLISGDTAIISLSLDTKNLSGINRLYLSLNNPDSAQYQTEQYFFNNFLYKDFYVKGDKYNPLLDVTFDGIHILNQDIVSAKPHIQIRLKDENKELALSDTSGVQVQLKFPGVNTPYRKYNWGTDTLRFTPPSNAANDNTAVVDFAPVLDQDTNEDGEYELVVSGKDRAGNKAGNTDYRVIFNVFNKPMISNLLNYPNPFSTSTAFVFTLTGSQLPQEFKIQILTITGKIVKEITKQELGNIHIGTNITEYKWDGTDTYGKKLANGVYLYRVVSSLDGKKMDKFIINDTYNQQSVDNTDKYFNKGYGKMVILR